ncbi:UdgX family uracil-DNA binding protein [Glycomyces algeriensis]|uniref:UdgX family uracil-DNA binding protein n=1 Tax=Glycomyces algeriensis TaxID=256037 RepID=UPI0022CFF38D|nr:UdgX family uracil-DNA binding protein [Glycomyces algeriensis]MDA1364988.1 UdgX family uracil-DNA binding protein [Glycomyces algeriensis]
MQEARHPLRTAKAVRGRSARVSERLERSTRSAGGDMAARHPGAQAWVPETGGITELRKAARSCEGCDLYREATQTVFGEGPAKARLFLVGEQPGDVEDQEGEPFVGPAGRLLDQALEEAGIERSRIYLTNAVKHFKFEHVERGNRRLHKKPTRGEAVACRPWLIAELNAVKPDLVVALGATAAQSLMGTGFRVSTQRGELFDLDLAELDEPCEFLATVHPSAVIRLSGDDRDEALSRFIADLAKAAETVGAGHR